MVALEMVRAMAERGLEGDRFFDYVGPAPQDKDRAREITLIEREALEGLKRDYGIDLDPSETRRNILTRGAPLNHLVGRDFRVGDVVLRGMRLCEPCGHLEKMTRKGVTRGLLHRGGLRAQILSDGVVRVGDTVAEVEPKH